MIRHKYDTNTKHWISIRKTARLLECSPTHAGKLCVDGTLEAKDIGRGSRHFWRVNPDSIYTYQQRLARRPGAKRSLPPHYMVVPMNTKPIKGGQPYDRDLYKQVVEETLLAGKQILVIGHWNRAGECRAHNHVNQWWDIAEKYGKKRRIQHCHAFLVSAEEDRT